MADFWIILTGAIVAVSCSLVGSYLMLRKAAMLGDAISHAVLPGIVLAFLVSNSRNPQFMLPGAALFGVLTTMLIEFLRKRARLQSDAAIGISFTFLFAVGVILISAFAGNVDIDQECVLYGDIALVPFDSLLVGSRSYGPVAVWLLGTNLLLIVAAIGFGYRGLFLTSFDPAFADTTGVKSGHWHYALMAATSLTTVFSFESVGAILVVAFLIVPPATAYLVTKTLHTMLWAAAGFGVFSAVAGFYTAAWLNTSVSATMATMAGTVFAAVFGFTAFAKKRLKSNPFSRKGPTKKLEPGVANAG